MVSVLLPTMATTSAVRRNANHRPRKRSVSEKESPTFAISIPTPKKLEFAVPATPSPTSYSPRTARRGALGAYGRRSSIDKAGKKTYPRSLNMDSQNSPSLTAPIPPFLSVYDSGSSRSSLEGLSSDVPQSFSSKLPPNDACFSPVDAPTFAHFHQPRNSTSTSASDSTESSPTTTVSLDSSSMTEPSPGPSPQSPASMNFAMDASRFTPLDSTSPDTLPIPFQERRPSTPAKRGRNLKNLAVNTSAAYNLGRAISTAPLKPEQEKQKSAPSSPLFVKPPTPPRRKMGNISLTIMTPANSTMRNPVPPTPSISRPTALRHFQSSPSLPLFTSGLGPAGGMTLPNVHPAPIPRGFAEIPMEDEEEEEEDTNFDVPQSQEEKPDSYPNGPIRIYESGIDLYYEPSVEAALRYDVILNVASEVKNPFDVADEEARRLMVPLQPSNNVGILADGPENAGSPTTPKATPIITNAPSGAFTPSLPQKRPEYIHIPWEHNTDIVPDLFRLVKVIDDRVNQGKTVLVHCQCGVSRSASLIVAYGLYKNPEISVQDAYNAVKKRSKWIGPNMSLIMQLQEFKGGLDRELSGASESFGFPRISTTLPTTSSTQSFDSKTPSAPPTPRTAPPVSEEEMFPAHLPPTGPFSAAPIEPASGSFWEAAFRRSWGSKTSNNNLTIPGVSLVTDTPYVDTKGHVVPVVTVLQNDKQPAMESSVESSEQSTQNPFRTPNYMRPLTITTDYELDTQMTDAPSIEPVLSPRSTEFHMAPLIPPATVGSFDEFNILSPTPHDFHSPILSSRPNSPPQASSPHQTSSPPEPRRAAPPPPLLIQKPVESLDSIFSPTSGSPPRLQPLWLGSPTQNEFLGAQYSQASQRIDSLIPQSPPLLSTLTTKENRKLRSKYSAPNLSQCLQLQKIQTEIASSLPKRAADDEDALLSPRVTNFIANPFHDLPKTIPENGVTDGESREQQTATELEMPSTPGSTNSDPRSPAHFGLSPITRNIWGMI